MLSSLSGKRFAKDLQSLSITADLQAVRLPPGVLLFQFQLQDFTLIFVKPDAALVGQSSSLLRSLYRVVFPFRIFTSGLSMVSSKNLARRHLILLS